MNNRTASQRASEPESDNGLNRPQMTLQEAARHMGVTCQCAQQTEARALEKFAIGLWDIAHEMGYGIQPRRKHP